MNEDGATLEKKEDAGKGQAGVVKRWLKALDIADKQEAKWRKTAQKVVERFRQSGDDDPESFDKKSSNSKFNILWSNTEVMRPALYHSTPKPDVRRRFRDEDPIGKVAADILERGLAYSIDSYDFDQCMTLAVLDLLLPGRAVTRVRYEPTLQTVTPEPEMPQPIGQDAETGAPQYHPDHVDEAGQPVPQQAEPFDKITYQATTCEHVAWKDFRRGPGRTWEEVTWIAFQHRLTREQLEKLNATLAEKVSLDVTDEEDGADKDDDDDKNLFKRGIVWEIWDKEAREVLFIAPSVKEEPLKQDDDVLGLKDFFPIPRPMYALESTDSLVPVELFKLYKDQADELDRITKRINKLIEGLKLRGIYDSTLKVLGDLMNKGDNALIPADDGAIAIFAQGGSFDKAIWLMPIDMAANVLKQLYIQRDQIKQTIYEITGLSDILRGDSDPNETLGAQQIKAQSGSRRLRRLQKEVQRYARDLMRLCAEIMAEHFEPFMFELMAGKQEPIPPQVIQLLKSDLTRSYRVDIETDSTIAEDEQADQKAIVDLLDGITRYVAAIGPVVQTGYMPAQAAVSLLKSIIRRFRLGREVEDALDDAQGQIEQSGGQVPPSPEQKAAQAEMQQKQQAAQMDMEVKQQQLQLQQQAQQADLDAKMQAAHFDQQAKAAEDQRQQQAFEREQLRLDQASAFAMERHRAETSVKIDMMKQHTAAQIEATKAKERAKPKTKVA